MYNPNSYPVYAEFAKDYNSTSEKGSNSLLSSFNLSNPYISAIASITSLLGRKGSNTTSQDVEVGCIIDFTLANTTSLAVVQAESAFITEGFHELKGEVLSLFEDYMSVVDYNVSLTRCRKEDDWDVAYRKVDAYFEELQSEVIANTSKEYKRNANIEFAINQLVSFIDEYDTAVKSAQKYHSKFERILDSYQPTPECKKYLPADYVSLKDDIDQTMSKFRLSYNTAEIKGSKLKEILYGVMY